MVVLQPGGPVAAAGALLAIPAGASGFRFKAKPVVVVVAVVVAAVVVVAVAVDVVVEEVEAAPGAFKLKPSVPVPVAAAVVDGVQRERPVAAEEAGVVAREANSVGPALVVAAAGAGAAGCVAPAPVDAGVAGVKGSPPSAVGGAKLPIEPMLKPEAPLWVVLPPVNEKPPGVVDGAAEVVVEPNTKPVVGAVLWPEVTVLEMALVRVPPPRPKPPG